VVADRRCADCPALCCHGLVIPIEKPKSRAEVDELKWYIQYDTVRAFIRSHRWYILVEGRCQYLDQDNLCTIYERRPEKCRRLNPPDCERFGAFYDVMLNNPEELDSYLAGVARRRRQRRRRASRSSARRPGARPSGRAG